MAGAAKLREMLSGSEIHVAPGVFDGMTARLAQRTGFGLLYASGGAIARSCGFPDIGLLTFTEMCTRLQHILEVVDVPVIADADTGFGNAINASHTVQVYERLGIAGMHIEDQTFPKRCGHLDDKSVICTAEMADKIAAVKVAQHNPDFVVIARTDAIAVEGIDSAIERSHAYLRAGADMIFVEAPETVEQIEQIAREIPQPKLLNMFHTGRTPVLPLPRLRELGYRVVIVPSDLQRAMIAACSRALDEIHRTGNTAGLATDMATFREREEIIGSADYLAIAT